MSNDKKRGKIIIPAGVKPWPHEMRVANILSEAGYRVKFIPEKNIKTADILLNNVEYEIKSPRSANSNSLEHLLKKALKQSRNIIIDTSRIKKTHDNNICKFLLSQLKSRKQIKKLLLITKSGKCIDIKTLL